jgi:hypothetical protein
MLFRRVERPWTVAERLACDAERRRWRSRLSGAAGARCLRPGYHDEPDGNRNPGAGCRTNKCPDHAASPHSERGGPNYTQPGVVARRTVRTSWLTAAALGS